MVVVVVVVMVVVVVAMVSGAVVVAGFCRGSRGRERRLVAEAHSMQFPNSHLCVSVCGHVDEPVASGRKKGSEERGAGGFLFYLVVLRR